MSYGKIINGETMNTQTDIFEENYAGYCETLAEIDLSNRGEILGAETHRDTIVIPFFDEKYIVSQKGISDENGNRPNYARCVILAQYVLRCPQIAHHETDWVAFRDLKKISHFTNVRFFQSDTEKPITDNFDQKKELLAEKCISLGGSQYDENSSYDLACIFKVLPKISLLLLFNDSDEDFPAACSVLFQKQAEHYLDPESLAMTSAMLARKLTSMI